MPAIIRAGRTNLVKENSFVRGLEDRGIAGTQHYEVGQFARKHRLSTEQVYELVRQHGNDRQKLEQAVASLK